MSAKTRKNAAAAIRKLREENTQLKSNIDAYNFDLVCARNEVRKRNERIEMLEYDVAKYKNLLTWTADLYWSARKEATKANIIVEKYRAKVIFWQISFSAVFAGVVIDGAIRLFLK